MISPRGLKIIKWTFNASLAFNLHRCMKHKTFYVYGFYQKTLVRPWHAFEDENDLLTRERPNIKFYESFCSFTKWMLSSFVKAFFQTSNSIKNYRLKNSKFKSQASIWNGQGFAKVIIWYLFSDAKLMWQWISWRVVLGSLRDAIILINVNLIRRQLFGIHAVIKNRDTSNQISGRS